MTKKEIERNFVLFPELPSGRINADLPEALDFKCASGRSPGPEFSSSVAPDIRI